MDIKKLDCQTRDTLLESIAKMHKDQLSAGVLADLNVTFLAKLYQSMTSFPSAAVFVVEHDSQLLGFAACTTNTNKFYKYFIKHNIGSVIFTLPKLCSPSLIKRSFSLFKYLINPPKVESPKAELLSIVVSPEAHRLGLGKRLMTKIFDFMQEHDVPQFKVVAADTQHSAQRFYESIGGSLASRMELGSLASNVYYFTVKDLSFKRKNQYSASFVK